MPGFNSSLLINRTPVTMLLLLLLASFASASCPPSCECAPNKYECSREGNNFTLTFEVNDYAKIVCQGGNLTCSDFPTLPVTHNGHLPTLFFDSCSLPPALACFTEALSARDVGTLRVENCFEVGETHLEDLRGLSELWIRDSMSQKSLPFDAMARIPTLLSVVVHNTTLQLSPSSAQNTHLQELELSFSGIKDIPKGAFKGLRGLAKLFLYLNKIEEINEGAFEGLDHLEYLDLSSNPLRALAARALAGARRLRTLKLHLTALRVVSAGAFEGLDLLEKIDIKKGSKPLQFEALSLANLPSLRNILIDSSPLLPLPDDLFQGSKAIENVTIISCGLDALPESIFADQRALKNLKLNSNRIKELPEHLLWTLDSLEMLDLTGNIIEVLPGAIFEGLTNLKVIHLDSNHLTTIPPSTFSGPKHLLKLTLRDNFLTLLDDEKNETHKNDSPFSKLVKLEELDLSGNLISVIFEDWRSSWIHEIKKIDLSRNRIQSLEEQDLEFVGSNVTVDLRYNNITTVAVRPDLHSKTYYLGATFILDHNPIDCNCSLHHFLYFTRNHKFPKFSISETFCFAPQSLFKQKIQDLPLDSLTCDLKECPKSCSCIKRKETSTIELDCFEPPLLGLPIPKSHNLTKSKVRFRNFESLSNLPEHVVFLDLHNLSLTEVPSIPHTVLNLDLRFNHLTVIPKDILRENLTLYLVGNKIKCDCWDKEQIEMMEKFRDSIKDFDSIVCDDGSYLHKLNPGHICDVWWATVIGCSLAATGVLAAVVAGITYYYIREIKKYIYKQGWPLPPGVYEDEIDSKTYDVLVSYSDTYEKFTISRLVPLLRSAGYTVCLRCVEWDIGDFLPNKVSDLVEKSRRTVVLLSSDYFDSDARLELRAALMDERRGKRKRVLLVVTKDLESDPSVDKFLQTRKNLALKDALFWERLKRQLPKKRKKKNVKPNQRTLNVLMTTEQKKIFSSKLSLNQL